jgi:hypothetical protein
MAWWAVGAPCRCRSGGILAAPAGPGAGCTGGTQRPRPRANQVEQTGDPAEPEQPEHRQAREKAQETHDQVTAKLAGSRAAGAGQAPPPHAEEASDNGQEPEEPPRRRGGRNPNQY